MKEESVPD